MEKVSFADLIKHLRTGEKMACPECGKGEISTPHNPETAHFFCCDKCDFMINID